MSASLSAAIVQVGFNRSHHDAKLRTGSSYHAIVRAQVVIAELIYESEVEEVQAFMPPDGRIKIVKWAKDESRLTRRGGNNEWVPMQICNQRTHLLCLSCKRSSCRIRSKQLRAWLDTRPLSCCTWIRPSLSLSEMRTSTCAHGLTHVSLRCSMAWHASLSWMFAHIVTEFV